MKQRIFTIIVTIMLISLTPFSGVVAYAKTSVQAFDTVLVLDVSGSMDSEMSDMKSSAVTFCSDILAANNGNKIAVVSFAYDGEIVCGLTNDLSQLTAAINGLNAYGQTNMVAGCKTAYDIITSTSSENKIKNVIIMADGYPCYGDYLETGRYNSMFPQISVVYENKVYDYVSSNLHPVANVYTVGFFGDIDATQPSLYDDYTQLSIQLMNDLSNASSYFPTSADSMFDGIAENMISNSGSAAATNSSAVTVIICVCAAGGGIGIIALIIFLATRKPPAPPAPIMSPILPIIVDEDDDEKNNNNPDYINNGPPAGIEKFAADAGAVRNDGYYVVPSVSVAKVYGLSGTYRNFDFEVKDGEIIRIGRDPASCNLVITEDTSKVSRAHCTISYNAAQRCFVVTDLSKNGTFTKTIKLPYNVPTNISCGSEIQLADSCNIFRLG